MKQTLSLIISLSMLSGLASCGGPSSDEFKADFGKKFCYKIAECAQEQLKELTPEQKKMAMGMIPTKEKCDSPESRFRKEYEKENKELTFTSEQIKLGMKCLEEVEKSDCSVFEKSIPVCDEFSKATKAN
ncbi:MAG: hypothetical protein OEZ34_14205 [Spirochaetia bacterium]|nr:hypothetical protein [Spirochaetia bacterium]